MKVLIALLILTFSFASTAQVDRLQQKTITVKLTGQIFNLPHDTIRVAQYMGKRGYRNWGSTIADEKGNFAMEVELPSQDYYVVRVGERQHVNVIFQGDEEIALYGDGKNIAQFANFVGSPESTALNEFIRESNAFQQQTNTAQAYLKQHPDKKAEVNQQYKTVRTNFTTYRTKFIAANRKSPALLAVLSTYEIPKEFKAYEVVANELLAGFPASPVVQSIVPQLKQNQAKYNNAQILAPGKLAPEIELPNLEGELLKLSSLKGKVVLIDFWASWCGPCRRENPNVVRVYEKYNKDGFEIFSVSLDKDKSKWQYAIDKDNLKWPNHVSDLKGWASAAGRAYGVSSIPFTVLIDAEGKIIQTKLRGNQLEEALSAIFGH